MNAHDRDLPGAPGELAVLHYGDGEFAVLRAGRNVRCAVSGKLIPVENLRYWSAALQEAYESGKLRGSQLIQARRVIERRRTQGRSIGGRMPSRKPNEDVTTSSLVRNYQREVERQKLLVRKAETAQRNLLFIVGALRQLLADENFTNLLRAEGLDTLPQYLADRVWARGSGA